MAVRYGLTWLCSQPLIWLLLFALQAKLGFARPGTTVAINGTTIKDNNDAKLYCDKTKWQDVFWFFFTNYILHALSVRSLPGENFFSSTVFKFCCLLVPYTGVRRGLCLISRASNLASNDLQAAARANALCFITRRPDWRPTDGDRVPGKFLVQDDTEEKGSCTEKPCEESSSPCDSQSAQPKGLHLHIEDLYKPTAPSSSLARFTRWLIDTHRFKDHEPNRGGAVDLNTVKLQGRCDLAAGYGLSYIPSNVKVYPRQPSSESHGQLYRFNPFDTTKETKIASTHDVPRILFSLVQTVSGGYAIYKARGSQIDRYGFAAFGLTVIPYMVVSIINFLGSLLTSEYETVYMVHSATMDEMIARGGHIDGAVGTLDIPAFEVGHRNSENWVEPQGDIITFHKDGGLYCRRNEGPQQPILPYEPPLMQKLSLKKRLLCGYYWLRPPSSCDPPPAPKVPCITVPSQSPFTLLPEQKARPYLDILALLLLFIAIAAPYVAMGILSGFRANRSTSTQRNFVLIWLVAGQFQGYLVNHVERHMDKKTAFRRVFAVFVAYGSNCLCGLVIVAQEMIEFGTCKSLD